jgi:hypothetical protein
MRRNVMVVQLPAEDAWLGETADAMTGHTPA